MDAPQCSWASSTSLPACPSTAAELAQILEQGGSNRAAAGAEIRGRMGSAIARAPPQLRQQRAHQPSGRLCTTQVPKGCVAYNEQPAWYPWCKCIGAIQASFLPPGQAVLQLGSAQSTYLRDRDARRRGHAWPHLPACFDKAGAPHLRQLQTQHCGRLQQCASNALGLFRTRWAQMHHAMQQGLSSPLGCASPCLNVCCAALYCALILRPCPAYPCPAAAGPDQGHH